MRVWLVILFLGCLAPQSVSAQVQFKDTEAAKAFIAKDFDRALEEFQKLRESNPNNTLILQYLAITLKQLGRFDEAIDIFREALAIAPNNPALNYQLGVTFYNAKRGDEAVDSFTQTKDLAPESRYAELAAQYLDAISQQRAQNQVSGAPKRFGIFAQAGYQYDDNIPAFPDGIGGDRTDNRYTGYLNLDFYLHRSPTWLITTSLNGYGTWYEESEFEVFEAPQYSANIRLQRTHVLGKIPAISSIDYNYRKVDFFDETTYSRSNSLTLGLRLNLSRATATYGFYQYTEDNFSAEGFDPLFSSRDADNHMIGLRHTWFFANRRGQFAFGIDYEDNNADGINFEYDGFSASLDAVIPLFWKMRGDLGVRYGEDSYDMFAGPVTRETDRISYTAGFSRWINRNFQWRFTYNYWDEDSSYDELSYDRAVWGLNLNYVY